MIPGQLLPWQMDTMAEPLGHMVGAVVKGLAQMLGSGAGVQSIIRDPCRWHNRAVVYTLFDPAKEGVHFATPREG